MTPTHAFDVLKERGFVSQVTDEAAVRAALGAGPVTFYVGFDPTASSLHAGSLLPLMAMAQLQRLGHRPIFILGGGTAMVGDPSGKTEMRQMLTPEQIRENGLGLKRQFERFCSLEQGQGRMLDNAEWLLPLNYIEFLRDIGRHFSVNRMLAHESTRIRLERGLSFLEFNYQLLQAYDFLTLFRRHGCSLQMGGDDQWGNIVAGMDLIRRLEAKEAHGLTFPLLTTAAGEKMGKTARGAVWLDAQRTSPHDFFQYFRNTDDRDVERFLKFFTFLPLEQIQAACCEGGAKLNAAKETLALEVTRIVHGEEAARGALRAARSAFGKEPQDLADVPTSELDPSRLAAGVQIVALLKEVGLAKSLSDARRLVQQGGVRVWDQVVGGIEQPLKPDDFRQGQLLLWAGKKRAHRVILKG